MKHCLLNGLRNVVFKTTDTDVVTLLLAHPSLLDSLHKIEVDFNFGKMINNIYSRITPEHQLALMFFSAFTGCYITSSLFDIPKGTWWNVCARMHSLLKLLLI